MIAQKKNERFCGQIAVAHIAGVDLSESILAFGHKHGTKVREVVDALDHFGYNVINQGLTKPSKMPKLGIGKMRWRKENGILRGWHWVAVRDGVVLDGMEHSRPGEITSWLVIEE